MADFVQNAEVKSAVRTLTTPIEDVTAFNNLVQSVITSNLFGCVVYMSASGDDLTLINQILTDAAQLIKRAYQNFLNIHNMIKPICWPSLFFGKNF